MFRKKYKYFIETQRSNVTPKVFFSHCKRLLAKAGNGASSWLDNYTYEHWSNPSEKINITRELEHIHSDCFDIQDFHGGAYNFIMEFNFDNEKRGHGYMFAFEVEGWLNTTGG